MKMKGSYEIELISFPNPEVDARSEMTSWKDRKVEERKYSTHWGT